MLMRAHLQQVDPLSDDFVLLDISSRREDDGGTAGE